MLFKNKYLNILMGLLAAFALLAPGFASAQKLSRAAPFPEASEELYGIGSGGKLYVFGGLAPGWTPKGLVYEYDPASDAWTPTSTAGAPSPRRGNSVVWTGNEMVIWGGRSDKSPY